MAITQIRGSQIKDGTVYDTQIASTTWASGAGIKLSKLEKSVIAANGSVTFTAAQSMGGFRLTNVAQPESGTDAVNRDYVDGVAQGLDIKESCKTATTATDTDIVLSGLKSVGGYTVVDGDRILVKNQDGAPTTNGIYIAHAGAWVRATDADGTPANEVSGGMFTFIEDGTLADTGWVLSNITGNAIVGTSSLSFTQFSGAGSYTAGTAIDLTGSSFSAKYDTSTIGVNGTNQLYIVNGGVTETQLNASVAGNGLTGGGGSALAVGNDDGTITVGTNGIKVTTNSIGPSYLTTAVAGDGLNGGNGTALSVEPNATNQSIEVTAAGVAVIADGIDSSHIDWGTSGAQVNASLIPTTTVYTGTSATVVDALQELYGIATTADNGLTASSGLRRDLDAFSFIAATNGGLNIGAGTTGVNVITDGSTIQLGTAGAVMVKANGITEYHINQDAVGDGLAGGSGTVITVNAATSTFEFVAQELRVKTDGINTTQLDWGVGANQIDASDMPVTSAYTGISGTTGTNVDQALVEIYNLAAAADASLTASAGVTRVGDDFQLNPGTNSGLSVGATYVSVNTDNVTVEKGTGGALGVVANSIGASKVSRWGAVDANNGRIMIGQLSGDNSITIMSGDATLKADGSLVIADNFVRSTTVTTREGLAPVNGTNVSFTLTATPVADSEQVFLNGLLQEPGLTPGSNDYQIAADIITFSTAPSVGDRIRVNYLETPV